MKPDRQCFLAPVVRTLERSSPGRAALRSIRRWRSRPILEFGKVLCIGNLKTGTSSFAAAMRRLGYSHYGFDHDMQHTWLPNGQIERCLRFAEAFDSFDDRPWSDPDLAGAFARAFPGSLFVLLERETGSWSESWRAHFRKLGQPVHLSNQELEQVYHEHNERILTAVGNHGPVLRMNICAGDGYELLCPFLRLPILREQFPLVNQTQRHAQ